MTKSDHPHNLSHDNTVKHRPISVVFFAHSSHLGGAERSLIELIRELITDYGVICTVVVPSAGPLGEALFCLGARVICCDLCWWFFANDEHHGDSARNRLAQASKEICRNLIPQLKALDPDVIFTQTMVVPWGALAASVLNKPHIWHVCEFDAPEHMVWFGGQKKEMLAAIEAGSSFLLTAADAIRTTLFPDVKPDRIRTIYRHIPMPDRIEPATDSYRSRDAVKLGIFGSVTEAKGQQDAVRAMAELQRRTRNVELLVAGAMSTFNYRARILDLVQQLGLSDRVTLCGFLSDPYPAMAATDIVLVCSRQEGFGRVAAEAMLLGRPVVYAATGGMLEYMKDGETGLSYQPGNVAELVSRIGELIDDPIRAARIGAAAQRHARKMFSRQSYGGEVFRILHTLRTEAPHRRVQVPSELIAVMVDVIEAGKRQDALQLNARIAALERTISILRASNSWRITAPLRGAMRTARQLGQGVLRLTLRMQFGALKQRLLTGNELPNRALPRPAAFEQSVIGSQRLNSEKASDRAVSTSNHPSGQCQVETGRVCSIRFLYDTPGWSYYNNGRDLAKHAPQNFRVTLARLLSESDLPTALGEDAPDFVIVNRPSDIACVRKELDKRRWHTKLIAFWSTGWPRGIEQLGDVVKNADLINFVNKPYWRNAGMLKHSICVPLGVDLDVFRPLVPIEKRPRRILWLGSQINSAVKGYEAIVVRLREELTRAGFECDFRVLDSFGSNLLSQAEMVEWYNTGRAFLCTSTVEGTPNVALEAAACGCAIISTRVGNMPELIRHNINGMLVEVPHHQTFYDVIVRSEARWPDLAQAMLLDIGDWSWQRRAEQIFAALRMSLAGSKQPSLAAGTEAHDGDVSCIDQFGFKAVTKRDLSDRVSVFVTTVGLPSFELCLHYLNEQDCSFRSTVIANVAPMSAAFQRMLDECETDYFVQVDEDMLLYPHAVRTLSERIESHPAKVALHVEYLYDTHLQKCIQGVKIFRTEIVRRYPFRNVLGCESDQINRFRKDGFDYVVGPTPGPDDPFGDTLGLHGTNFSRETAYLRYFVLQQRHRRKPWDWRMMTVELAEQLRNEPSELNFFSLGGALAGMKFPIETGEKDFRRYSETPGLQELADFYDLIAGRK